MSTLKLNANALTKIVLVVEYDGTDYCGFQWQSRSPTIQGEIEKAIFRLTGERRRIMGASRTDTGVHAKGQVVSFRTGSKLLPETFIRGLNYYLPVDISVKAAYIVPESFNVQKQAVSRKYRYEILNDETRSPLRAGYTYRVGNKLDVQKMNEASQLLVGEHDFISFVTSLADARLKSTLRTVFKAEVKREEGLVVFHIEAGSFLPHQVRNTIGCLVSVGLGKISVAGFREIMEAKKAGLAKPTAPACGLYLVRVNYRIPLGEIGK